MESRQLNWIANFTWGIAGNIPRSLYMHGKYRDVILPMTVLLRFDVPQEPTKRRSSTKLGARRPDRRFTTRRNSPGAACQPAGRQIQYLSKADALGTLIKKPLSPINLSSNSVRGDDGLVKQPWHPEPGHGHRI